MISDFRFMIFPVSKCSLFRCNGRLMVLIHLVLLGSLQISCGPQVENEIRELKFNVDTVQIDSGDELLFLKWGLKLSGLSEDEKYLYNFDVEQHQLEKIDLDSLSLERKIPFDREGPNGLSGFHSLTGWEGDKICFGIMKGASLYDQEGRLYYRWEVNPGQLEGDVLNAKESLDGVKVDPFRNQKIFGFAKAYRNEVVEFATVDLDNQLIFRRQLPLLNRVGNYTAYLNDGENSAYYEAETYLEVVESGVLFGAEIGREFYHYDPEADTIRIISHTSKFLEAENGARGQDFLSVGEFSKFYQQYAEGPHYFLPIYDAKNKRYWRLFYSGYFDSEIKKGPFPRPIGTDVYLALYDEEFKLIQEANLPFLSQTPLRHFIKDGMLWLFINMEDEMGFIRLKICDL